MDKFKKLLPPDCKVDVTRDYWRYHFAGLAMQSNVLSAFKNFNRGTNKDEVLEAVGIISKFSVRVADALLAELEKTEGEK